MTEIMKEGKGGLEVRTAKGGDSSVAEEKKGNQKKRKHKR